MDEQRKRLRLTLPQEMEESILALQKSRYPQQSLSQVLRLLLSLGLEQAAREQDRTLVRLWVDGDADAYSRFILDDWDAICRQAGYQGGIRLIPPNTSEILFSLS